MARSRRSWADEGLTRIQPEGNSLNGLIPSTIGQLTKLTSINLNVISLNGPITSTIAQLTKLMSIDLPGNLLSGPISSTIGQLTVLGLGLGSHPCGLQAGRNRGGGRAWRWRACLVPRTLLTRCPRLCLTTCSNLGANSLTLSIPLELGRLTGLQYLYLQLADFEHTVGVGPAHGSPVS